MGWLYQSELSEKLQNFKFVLSEITKSGYDTSSRFLRNSLGWDNLSVRRAKQKVNLMYNDQLPKKLSDIFSANYQN